ncbi:hypothetical protein OEG84_25160 [Hoeflea sp. G2-23]|uniref:NusG-like N-terminal domain-containing protein n=1 Tax=Hoeflea algicola TaxID=2983763 RepID=A0ABT3ZGM3_9HYPH|nr:transcription termination/antitermination NusG family protein [Hoeflea algicola]MCY0150898.1 hypothetical protein [Hoeflea algicola]
MNNIDHNWYAVRISGQATRVSNRRIVFAGPKGGAHQFIVPDINQKTNIEVALDTLGIDYFIPMAITETPHRRKRNVMVTRRQPIIQGYAFVRYVDDWHHFDGSAAKSMGIFGVIRDLDNAPVRVWGRDIHDLRMIEWQAFCDYVDPPKARSRRRFIEGSRHVLRHKPTDSVISVTIQSVTNRNTVKAIADRLGKFEFAVDDVEEAA